MKIRQLIFFYFLLRITIMIEVLLLVAKGQLKCEITLRDMIMLCSSKPFQSRATSRQLFGITKPRKKPKVDSIHEIKLRRFCGFISQRVIAYFSKLRDHYAMQISKYTFMRWGNLSVGFITYHGYSMKNLCFPRINITQIDL